MRKSKYNDPKGCVNAWGRTPEGRAWKRAYEKKWRASRKGKEWRAEQERKPERIKYLKEYYASAHGKNLKCIRESKRRGNTIICEDVNKEILIANHQGRCAYCGKEVKFDGTTHVDHIIPLSRYNKLGKKFEYKYSNLAPACASCNLKKHDKTPLEFFWSNNITPE